MSEVPDLDYAEQIRQLLAETRDSVRIRIFAHPTEGDQLTDELVQVCQNVLTLAPGRTRFDRDDPLSTPAAAEEARILGVEPLGTLPGERHRRQPLPEGREYRSMIVAIGQEILVIPQVTADRGPLEFQVAEAISRMLHGPRLVGLVTSEARSANLSKLIGVLDRLDVRQLSLDEPISAEYSAVLVVGPGETIGRDEAARLRQFLAKGRSVGLLLDGMEVEPMGKRYRVRRERSGLEGMLESLGVTIEHDLLYDNACGRVSVPARVGRMMLPYPPIPTIPILDRLATPDAQVLRLPFPSTMRLTPVEGMTATPLLRSSHESWRVTGNWNLSPFQDWSASSFDGPFELGVILTGQGPSSGRLVVIANARFVEDQYLGVDDNAVFLRQLVEWLGGHRALSRLIVRAREEG